MEQLEGYLTMMMNNLGEILMAVGFLLVAAAVVIPIAMGRDNDGDSANFQD